MTADLDVRIGHLHFRGYATPQIRGLYIGENGWEGWDDGVDASREETDRPFKHGAFDAPGFLATRSVTAKGVGVGLTLGEVAHIGGSVSGLLAGGEIGTIVASYRGVTKWARCRRGLVKPRWSSVGGELFGQFEFELWMSDPILKGETLPPVGPATSISLIQYGNFIAYPVIEVTGSMPSGYSILGPSGYEYRVTLPLIAGNPHVIDMQTGLMRVGGVVQIAAVAIPDTWGVPAGSLGTPYSLAPVTGSGVLVGRIANNYS